MTIAPRQKQSIDEMMVPYKGNLVAQGSTSKGSHIRGDSKCGGAAVSLASCMILIYIKEKEVPMSKKGRVSWELVETLW